MIENKGQSNAPAPHQPRTPDRAAPTPTQPVALEQHQLDLQNLQVSESSTLTALLKEALAPTSVAPDQVARRGTRTYDTGVSMTTEVLFVSA